MATGLLRWQVDVRSLVIFRQVAEVANMTIAAQRLGVTQSAVSQAVRQLEDSLRVPLVDRTRRPLTLTPAGLDLLHRAEGVLEALEAIPNALMQTAQRQLPIVRFGMIDTFATTAGSRFTKALMDAAVQIHLESGMTPELGEALLSRRLDIIVTTDALDDVNGLERVMIWREPLVVAVPFGWALRDTPSALGDLAAKGPLIRYTARSQLGTQIERQLRRSRLDIPRRLEIDSSEAVLAMVAEGVGWAITSPLCLMQGRMHVDKVQVFPIRKAGSGRTLSMIGRAGEHGTFLQSFGQAARAILNQYFLTEIERRWPWLRGSVSAEPPDADA